jgi:transcriptional regulator with XRE-family HTH domain
MFVADSLTDLIADAPKTDEALDRPGPSKAIDQELSMLGLSQGRFSLLTGVAESSIRSWRRAEILPSIESVLRMCALAGLSLPAFLRGSVVQLCEPIPPEASPWSKPRRVDWHAVERHLVATLTDPGRPSLADVARAIGVERRELGRRLPSLTAVIVDRRSERLADETQQRREAATEAVEDAVAKIVAAGGDPSRRAVERLLPDGLLLREPALQDAWRRSLVELSSGSVADGRGHAI